MAHALPHTNGSRMQHRVSLRRFQNEWLHIGNSQLSVWQTIGSALNVKISSFGSVVSQVDQQGRCEFALNVEVRNLHIAKMVDMCEYAGVHAIGVSARD